MTETNSAGADLRAALEGIAGGPARATYAPTALLAAWDLLERQGKATRTFDGVSTFYSITPLGVEALAEMDPSV